MEGLVLQNEALINLLDEKMGAPLTPLPGGAGAAPPRAAPPSIKLRAVTTEMAAAAAPTEVRTAVGPNDDVLYDAVVTAMKYRALYDAAVNGKGRPFVASDLAHALVVPPPYTRVGSADANREPVEFEPDDTFLKKCLHLKMRVNAARRLLAALGNGTVYGEQIVAILDHPMRS